MEAHGSTNWLRDFVAGATGGLAGMVVGHPFDTTKVQMQTQEAGQRYRGTLDAISSIKHHGLIRGFFRGLSYPLLTYGGVNAVIFGVYGSTLRKLANDRPPDLQDVYLAGCAGGVAQLVIASPVDRIKCILQAQIPHDGLRETRPGRPVYYHGPTECLRAVWRTDGVAGLYRGVSVMALRDIPSYGIYLMVYELISSGLHARQWTDKHGVIADVIGGGLAGTISWFAVMPFDVIKSRIQADIEGRYKGFMDCAARAVRQEGVRVLYKGTLITCLRGFPVNAATFLVYTKTLKYLNKNDGEEGGEGGLPPSAQSQPSLS